MKPWLVAVLVGVAFLGGILASGSLRPEREARGPAGGPQVGPAQAPTGPVVALGPGQREPAAGDAPAAPPRPTEGPRTPAPATGPSSGPPPISPPPLSPEAQAEGRRAAADLAADGGRGNGRVTHLVYDFDSEEERLAFEENQRLGWQRRLQREREIKVQIMRDKVGLTAGQEPVLVAILEAEAQERQRLVDALAAGTISRSSFDEQVRTNTQNARQELARLLTPAQVQAYEDLAPREQVLRDDTQ